MLGRNLPQGSETIAYHNTLFRVSELCWIKAVRLSIPEMIVRGLALLLGIGWIFAMKNAKGTYMNVEFLLAAFPLLLAWSTSGSLKIGCSGDFEEAYDSRRGMMSSLFTGWIENLRKKEPDWLHLKSSNYDLLLNPHRVAWIRPCLQWKAFPLVVAAILFGYNALLNLGLDLESYPVFDEFQILIFHGGLDTVRMLIYGVIGVSIAAFLLSVKRSVEICGTGGVQDVFGLTASDQALVLSILSGSEPSNSVKASVAVAPKKQPAPKANNASPQPKIATTPAVTPPASGPTPSRVSETPTRALSEDMKAAGYPSTEPATRPSEN
jgi:hypothetical protein